MDYKSYLEDEGDEGDDDDYAWRFGSLALDRRAFCEGRILFREGGHILGAESMLYTSREFVVPIFRSAIWHAREVCQRRGEYPPSRTERTGIFANSLRQAWKDAYLVAMRDLKKGEADILADQFFRGEVWWDIGVLAPRWTGFSTQVNGHLSRLTNEEVEDWLTEALTSDGEKDIGATLKELQEMIEVASRNIESSKRINGRAVGVLKEMGDALAPVSKL